jgi:hypothetical protein
MDEKFSNKTGIFENKKQMEMLEMKVDGEIKMFQGKHKLRQFMTTKSALQKILKGILHTDEEESQSQT